MELQQLRYLVAVAETGNFTRASERCHVAQPSLSQQIINLEKELNQKLFHRLGRRAVPTEAGSVFLQRAKRILLEVDDAAREIEDSQTLERSITVGAIPTLAPNLLPPMIALCRKHFPELTLRVQEDFRDNLIQGVRDGDLDLALVSMPVRDPLLNTEVILQEPLLLILAKDHPLASKTKVLVDDIKKEPFVMLGGRSTLNQEIHRFCGDNQFEPLVSCRCAQVTMVKTLVGMACGISILPKASITLEDRRNLIAKPLADRTPCREIAVIRHLQRFQSRGAEQFLKLLREHTQKPQLPLMQNTEITSKAK